MPRDATRTRELLIRAAEHRFAREGVAGARLRDVVRDAGQANDSAVGYHFGSREGLLMALVAPHIEAMERVRRSSADDLSDTSVAELVRLVVEPTAALLSSPRGRDFLRITEQLAGFSGVRTGHPAIALHGTVLADQLVALEQRLADQLPRAMARERVAGLITFLTASLAERARNVETGRRQSLAHRRYVAELVAMLTGAVSAEVSSGVLGDRA